MTSACLKDLFLFCLFNALAGVIVLHVEIRKANVKKKCLGLQLITRELISKFWNIFWGILKVSNWLCGD